MVCELLSYQSNTHTHKLSMETHVYVVSQAKPVLLRDTESHIEITL